MSVDLRGIRFRAWEPDDEEYEPVGPDDADETPGAVDLSAITIRAWEENELDNE